MSEWDYYLLQISKEAYTDEQIESLIDLLNSGASPHISEPGLMNTALHYAVKSVNPQAVALLLRANANPLVENTHGVTPLAIAQAKLATLPVSHPWVPYVKTMLTQLSTAVYDSEAEALRYKAPIEFAVKIGSMQLLGHILKSRPLDDLEQIKKLLTLVQVSVEKYQSLLGPGSEDFWFYDINPETLSKDWDWASSFNVISTTNSLYDRLEGCYEVRAMLNEAKERVQKISAVALREPVVTAAVFTQAHKKPDCDQVNNAAL